MIKTSIPSVAFCQSSTVSLNVASWVWLIGFCHSSKIHIQTYYFCRYHKAELEKEGWKWLEIEANSGENDTNIDYDLQYNFLPHSSYF